MGVNKYQPENPEQVDVLIIDNENVRRQQIEKIKQVTYVKYYYIIIIIIIIIIYYYLIHEKVVNSYNFCR